MCTYQRIKKYQCNIPISVVMSEFADPVSCHIKRIPRCFNSWYENVVCLVILESATGLKRNRDIVVYTFKYS